MDYIEKNYKIDNYNTDRELPWWNFINSPYFYIPCTIIVIGGIIFFYKDGDIYSVYNTSKDYLKTLWNTFLNNDDGSPGSSPSKNTDIILNNSSDNDMEHQHRIYFKDNSKTDWIKGSPKSLEELLNDSEVDFIAKKGGGAITSPTSPTSSSSGSSTPTASTSNIPSDQNTNLESASSSNVDSFLNNFTDNWNN